MRNRVVNRVTLLCWLSAATLTGLGLSRVWVIAFPLWWLLGFVPLLWLFTRRNMVAVILIVVAGVIIGFQRGSAVRHELHKYQGIIGSATIVHGVVADDPTHDARRRLDFRLKEVTIDGKKYPGEMRIRVTGGKSVARSDQVAVRGAVRDGFGNYQAEVSFGSIVSVTKSDSPIELLRRRFFGGVYNAMPDPQASLGLGFLVGYKSSLPDELQEQLQSLALTHIVVASGYNLTVLIRVARRMLARFSKFQALVGSLAVVWTMVMVTGLSPSMTRAAAASTAMLLLWFYGRKMHPFLLIMGGAAVTAWLNPLYLWSDLGWWLSFLAFAGVLLVAPLLTRRLFGERAPPLLVQVAIETAAAQIMVEPLIVLLFGQYSVLGLVANIVIVPFIPLAMLTTFIAGLAGLWLPLVAGWFALPATYVVGYIVAMVQWLSSVSWSSIEVKATPVVLASMYVIITGVLCVLRQRLHYSYKDVQSIVE